MSSKKAPRSLNFDAVRVIAMALPDVEETTVYGMPAFKAGTRRFVGRPVPREDIEPDTIGIAVSIAEREKLLATRPDLYYLTPHFRNYPAVLLRLPKVRREELQDILVMSWQYAMEKGPARKKKKPSPRR